MHSPQRLHQIIVIEWQRTPRSYAMTLQSLNGVRGYWGGPWVFVSEPLRTATMDYLATRGVTLNRNGGLSAPRFLHEMSGRHTVMDRDHVALVIQSLANRVGSGRNGGIGRENVRIRHIASVFIRSPGRDQIVLDPPRTVLCYPWLSYAIRGTMEANQIFRSQLARSSCGTPY